MRQGFGAKIFSSASPCQCQTNLGNPVTPSTFLLRFESLLICAINLHPTIFFLQKEDCDYMSNSPSLHDGLRFAIFQQLPVETLHLIQYVSPSTRQLASGCLRHMIVFKTANRSCVGDVLSTPSGRFVIVQSQQFPSVGRERNPHDVLNMCLMRASGGVNMFIGEVWRPPLPPLRLRLDVKRSQ